MNIDRFQVKIRFDVSAPNTAASDHPATGERIWHSIAGDVIVPGPGSQYSILLRLPAVTFTQNHAIAIAGEVTYSIGFGEKSDLLDFVLSYHVSESRWERIGGKMAEINFTDQPNMQPDRNNSPNPA